MKVRTLIPAALAVLLLGCGGNETAQCFPTYWYSCPGDLTPVVAQIPEPAPEPVVAPAPEPAPEPVVEPVVEPVPEPAPAEPAAGFAHTLPSGTELTGAAEGIEKNLIVFLEDPEAKPNKDTWFNFDRLTFAEGSAELDKEASAEQLTNLQHILAAYPNVRLKIGGYTDNTGKASANKKLSTERAKNVKDALVALGVDKKRLESEGYGQKHPVCAANDTEECKAQNRRIAVRVLKK